MTKATAIHSEDANKVPLFKDPISGSYAAIGKVEHKEVDGYPRSNKTHVPASTDNLKRLANKFAK